MKPTELYGNLPQPFEIIAEFVAASPTDESVRFVLDLARRWKERGGTVAGKPRHSDRYLDDLLRSRGTPIKSLTPKLAGRTNLRPADADILVRLFLSHWDYIGDSRSGEIVGRLSDLYRPMLPDDEVDEVSRYIEERISEAGPETRSEAEPVPLSSMREQRTTDIIAAEFQKSAALFTIGAGQTVLVDRPEMALIGFRDLMNRLWAIDRADEQERILVWTVDLGRQDFEDAEARARFMSVEALISRFKALRLFKENVAEARWNWLRSRTVIVLHDTRSFPPAASWLPAFDPNHVLFSAIPPRWLQSPEFRALYGTDFERLPETNYTIFLRRLAEEAPDEMESPDHVPSHAHRLYELHYFGHALLRSDEKGEREARGLKLNAPGRSYVEALGTVFAAATQTLEPRTASVQLSIDGMRIDRSHAIEKLRHHGFLLLRLDEFLKF